MIESKSEWISALSGELKRLMDFWLNETIDNENGGFYGAVDGAGNIQNEANKGAILNARILWSFSAAYLHSKDQKYLEAASRAFEYFIRYFIDQENGGVFWELDHKGKVVNSRKQAYAQGFAIYGLTEYYRASGHEESLNTAIRIYEKLEKYFRDDQFGGYIEALSADWQLMDDWRLSAKDANEPKSMNTHLHILEPYTNLYRCWKNDQLNNRIKDIIEVFITHIIDPKTFHFNLFFEMDWKLKSSIISYGHDIEGSWLLQEAAEVIEDQSLIGKTKKLAIEMVEATLKEGSAEDGSIFYEKEEELDTDRHWWPQAEAMVGYINAWQNSKNTLYLNQASKLWTYIQKYLLNRKEGEWYGRVDEKGQAYHEDNLVDFWKCPYHNSRALIEAYNRLKTN